LTIGLPGRLLKKKHNNLTTIDATIITGLFILGFAFQSDELKTSENMKSVNVRSWIIGITAPTTFPFVASFILLWIFPDYTSKENEE
jgi:hypothetical protein